MVSKEKALVFSGDLGSKVYRGEKTMTRRAITVPKHVKYWDGRPSDWQNGLCFHGHAHFNNGPSKQPSLCDFTVQCPQCEEGTRLWIREPAVVLDCRADRVLYLFNDGEERSCDLPKRLLGKYGEPPAWARLCRGVPNGCIREMSRTIIELTEVRVERLRDISTEDCIAEGLSTTLRGHDAEVDLHEQFKTLWNSTVLGRDACRYGWKANPWVWVESFKVVKS